jgi:transposase-like protein
MSERGIPFHCPYCGDENLRPSEQGPDGGRGSWECHACLRAFSLRMLGMIARPTPQQDPRTDRLTDTEVPQ